MKTKRILSALLLCIMVISLIPALPVYAEKTELEVKWNSGYVGSVTNNNKNKVVTGNADWLYTDIITLPKAGTRVSFTTSNPPTNSVSVFSAWKKSGSDWVFDPKGATIMATGIYTWIGQTRDGNNVTYEYVTDSDNESIRICTKNVDPRPTVYIEETNAKSTKKLLAENDFTATLGDDGMISGIKWMCGYASSASNTNGSAKEVKYYSATTSSSYAISNLIRIPKKGTEISFTVSGSPNNAYNAFTRYREADGIYVYDVGFAATDTLVRNGNTYTYITEKDNEVIRLCCRPNLYYQSIDIDPPTAVTWKATDKTGTAATVQKTEWPDPVLRSPLTGAELVGQVLDVKWNRGYIGSQYHATRRFQIAASAGSTYSYTDVITIPKAGTTVYFFDQSFTDYNGGMYASTSALSVSHWKKIGSSWAFDQKKPYLNACECPNADLDEYYRTYYYTTTEDNENIRLCFLSAPKYSGEDPIYPPVYIVEPSDFSVEVKNGLKPGLSSGSYTDAAGSKTEFGYYLPYTAEDGKQYPLVFDLSADGAVASYFAEKASGRVIAITFNGDFAAAMRLLDEAVRHLPVRVSDILFVGGKELSAHANTYSKFRVCQAMLYTDDGDIATDPTYNVKALSSFGSTAEAAEWLYSECEQYYRALEGLTMYAIGDSYFGGSAIGQHLTWVNLLGKKYGMNFHNYGIGGNTVAECSGRSENSPPMATRSTELPDGGDIYLIEGGRNDRHYNVPFGRNNSTNIREFNGAINTIISRIRKNNPDALIVLVTPWSHKQESGYLGTNNAYADTMKTLAEYYQNEKNDKNVVCLYAADENFTGINMSNPVCRRKYCIGPSDVSHLNPDGMNLVEPIFEKWIAEQYMTLKNIQPSPDDTDPELTTAAPETTAPAVPDDTTAPEKKSGCGSSFAVIFPAAIAAVLAGAYVSRKKEDK